MVMIVCQMIHDMYANGDWNDIPYNYPPQSMQLSQQGLAVGNTRCNFPHSGKF